MRTIFALFMLIALSSPAAAAFLRVQAVLVCETFAQAKRFAELGGDKAAIEAINKEFKPDACMAMRIAFVARRPVAKVQHGFETFIIVEVAVYGMDDGTRIQLLLSPILWYALAQPGQET